MSYLKYTAKVKNNDFIIEQDNPDVGWYLYVYENGKCIQDHLQDNLEASKEQAKELYSVPTEAWSKS